MTQIKRYTSDRTSEAAPPEAYFFGYGSLVNRDTHHFQNVELARLRGWRRVWRHTVIPDPTAEIDGLIAPVPAADWAALDEREGAYDRVAAHEQVTHSLAHRPEIAVYTIPEGKHGAPDETCPALLSYIDVVVQGYLREFGEAGVKRFFDTTDGWEAPVLNDRADPVYPRHRVLTADERTLVDDLLAERKVRLLPG